MFDFTSKLAAAAFIRVSGRVAANHFMLAASRGDF
jgi:hypothetical protein